MDRDRSLQTTIRVKQTSAKSYLNGTAAELKATNWNDHSHKLLGNPPIIEDEEIQPVINHN